MIHCIKQLLKNKVLIAAPTGIAAFNVDGATIYSLLSLPAKGEFWPLEGQNLLKLQEKWKAVKYLIIDEMSMVGRKIFAQIDYRLRQAFPESSDETLGGCSCIFGW